PLSVTIAAELRKVETAAHRESVRLWSVDSGNLSFRTHGGKQWVHPGWTVHGGKINVTPAEDSVDRRLDKLDEELKALRETIDELRDALKAGKAKGGD